MNSNRRQRGLSRFELLAILSVIVILVAVAVPNFLEAQVRSNTSKHYADMRNQATALEAYFVDQNCYPGERPLLSFSRDAARLQSSGGAALNTVEPGRPGLMGLTTPIAYISQLPPDPFAPEKGLPFAYHAVGGGWIFFSPGPDGHYDLNPTRDYDGETTHPHSSLFGGPMTYDPTNGVQSRGDIFRIKQ